MKPIAQLAEELGLDPDAWSPYGRWIAKVDPARVPPRPARRPGRIVLITGMTPSSHGVGKTVTMLSLGAALQRAGTSSISCLRQPSLGPVFGIKGGGGGGGKATVEPLSEVNLGLTGDLDAVTNAHNLLASVVDNHLHHGNALGIDPASVVWPRALDLEDRALREIEIGRGKGNGPVRTASFVITPASEVTAILGLAQGPLDLEQRLEKIEVAKDRSGSPVRAKDLGVGGAMAALLRHAILPNLLQTAEGTPVLVHGGPFGNLSYGTTTLSALHVARNVSDVVLVEAGFGTDLGAEKFVDLVAPLGGVYPSAAVVVASLPGLHAHAPGASGAGSLGPGLDNLDQHLHNLKAFGLETVVALNRYPEDDAGEIAEVRGFCRERNVRMEEASGFLEGSSGNLGLAEAVLEAVGRGRTAAPIYQFDQPIPTQIDRVVRTVYGGDGVDYSDQADELASAVRGRDPAGAPVCLAKTPLSLSDDPKKLGRPKGFRVRVRDLVPAAGAGYVVALLGDIQTMPGLPRDPRLRRIGIDEAGLPLGVV